MGNTFAPVWYAFKDATVTTQNPPIYAPIGSGSNVAKQLKLYQQNRDSLIQNANKYNKNKKNNISEESQKKINEYKLMMLQLDDPDILNMKNIAKRFNNTSNSIENFTSQEGLQQEGLQQEGPSQDHVTNQLLLKYDQKFNKNYDQSNILNKAIMSKNKMIYMTEVESAKKNKMIGIMTYLLILVIIIMFQVIVSTVGIIDSKVAIGISIFAIIIFLYKIYSNYIWSTHNYLTAIASATAKGMKNAAIVNLLPSDINKPYHCPAICKKKPNSPEEESTTDFNNNSDRLRFIRTDSSRDVWRLGDQPETTFTTKDDPKPYGQNSDIPVYRATEEEMKYNEPKPWFGGINASGATYYDCEWTGGDSKGMPVNKYYQNTTIPCHYYPGFKEIRRKICTTGPADPTNLDNCTLININTD